MAKIILKDKSEVTVREVENIEKFKAFVIDEHVDKIPSLYEKLNDDNLSEFTFVHDDGTTEELNDYKLQSVSYSNEVIWLYLENSNTNESRLSSLEESMDMVLEQLLGE